jgi:hypothetical protein
MGNYDDLSFDQNDTAQREIHPKGIFKAALVDIVDLGPQKNPFFDPTNPKSKESIEQIKLVWESAAKRGDGKPFRISRFFSKSLYDGSAGGKSSALHDLLSEWLGAEYTGRFESKKLEGRAATLVVTQETKNGKTKAKVKSVMPDESDSPYEPDGSYKRWVPKEQLAANVGKIESAFNDNEEVPF